MELSQAYTPTDIKAHIVERCCRACAAQEGVIQKTSHAPPFFLSFIFFFRAPAVAAPACVWKTQSLFLSTSLWLLLLLLLFLLMNVVDSINQKKKKRVVTGSKQGQTNPTCLLCRTQSFSTQHDREKEKRKKQLFSFFVCVSVRRGSGFSAIDTVSSLSVPSRPSQKKKHSIKQQST